MFPKVTLVLGGASSGKSDWAETLVLQTGKPPVYLASAQAGDKEMAAKISRHKRRRGNRWTTVEEPLNVASQLPGFPAENAVLFDCATLWLSNHMQAQDDIEAETAALIAALHACPAAVVVVSNETGQGIVPDNALARRFRDEQGRLNRQLAQAADLVVLITAGLPLVLKGSLPEALP